MQYSIPNSTRDAGFWIGARDDQCDDLGVTTEETNHDVHILGFFFCRFRGGTATVLPFILFPLLSYKFVFSRPPALAVKRERYYC